MIPKPKLKPEKLRTSAIESSADRKKLYPICNENDCSGIKKLSKDYLVCKAKSIKESANNVNNKIKEGSANKTKQITEGTKNIFNNIKNKINKN